MSALQNHKKSSYHYGLLIGGGLIIASSQIAIVRLAPGLTHTAAESLAVIVPFIALLSLPTLLLLVLIPLLLRVPTTRVVLVCMIAVGAVLRLVWLGAPAPIEDDFHRYLWDGAVTANGFNPYAHAPQDYIDPVNSAVKPQKLNDLAARAGSTLQNVNFPDLRSIYPGTAQVSFALAHWIAPFSIDGLRAVFLSCEIATLLLLMRLLQASGASVLWAALYWCNPFISAMLIGAAHVDVVIAPLLLGAVLLILRDRPVVAGACIGLAAGVKLWPALLAPLILRHAMTSPARVFLTLSSLAVFGAATILPLFMSSLQEGSFLISYVKDWVNNNGLFMWASEILQLFMPLSAAKTLLKVILAALSVTVAVALAWRLPASPADLYRKALIISGTAFYCSPAQFPWYASWFLPFTALSRCWPLIAVPVLLPAYYLFFPLWVMPYNWVFFYIIALIHALPILAWLSWRLLRAKLASPARIEIHRQA